MNYPSELMEEVAVKNPLSMSRRLINISHNICPEPASFNLHNNLTVGFIVSILHKETDAKRCEVSHHRPHS